MLLPSGDQSPPEASVEMLVTLRGSPASVPLDVSKSCTQICEPPSLDDSNRTRLPSGEKRMRSSPAPVAGVRGCASPPLMETIHRCGLRVFSSRLTSTTANATHLPSGETIGSPMRLSCIMSSKVNGRLPCAKPLREQQKRMRKMRRSMRPPRQAQTKREDIRPKTGKSKSLGPIAKPEQTATPPSYHGGAASNTIAPRTHPHEVPSSHPAFTGMFAVPAYAVRGAGGTSRRPRRGTARRLAAAGHYG